MNCLVVQTRDIGDVLLSTALCNALARNLPGGAVDMLTMGHCAGVVEGNPYVREILVLDGARRNDLRYMWRFLRGIRARRYDVVVNVQGQLIGLLTCLASGARRRIGFSSWPWRLAHTHRVRLHDHTSPSRAGRTLDDRFELLVGLCEDLEDRSYRIWLGDGEVAEARASLEAAGVDLGRPLVALGVNARDHHKRWPIESFVEVAAWLVRARGAQVLVTAGPGEREYSSGVRKGLPEPLRGAVFDSVATPGIRHLAALLSQCDLYAGNDSGPRHIAQSVDTPALAIMSPTSDRYGWVPWDDPRFRALDAGEALGMGREEWGRIAARLRPGVDDAAWFRRIEPGFVVQRLEAMLDDLGIGVSERTAPAGGPNGAIASGARERDDRKVRGISLPRTRAESC